MSKDGYNINEPPVGNILPKVPPKAPPTVEYIGKREVVCKGCILLGSGCGKLFEILWTVYLNSPRSSYKTL